uniref:Uncharacterized protein n=1 Tax=Sphaerodactylus townsendi TaxID=933632 RepID=A0ACB8ET89_9SAUR
MKQDKAEGATRIKVHSFYLSANEVSVNFVNLNTFYKQGFPYTGKMKVSIAFEDVPLQNETVYLTVDVNDVETHIPYVTDENGEVHFSVDTTNWNNTLVAIRGRHSTGNGTQGDLGFIRAHMEAYNWLKPFYSESNSFLEIQNVEEELPCGKDQEVLVDYIIDRKELGPEADHVDFYYLVSI